MAGKTFLCLFTSSILINLVKSDIIVETNNGKVKGIEVTSIIENEKYYSFMGIPYAKPPLRELRFMPPQPHGQWEDVLDATKEKKHCAQFNLPISPIKNVGFCGQEDCLHLGIHTPAVNTEGSKLPVIVFLRNEDFKMTFNGTKDYGPDFFMSEDVIIVMISHRVGSLGFISYEDNLLPGNNGIRDVILALQWIQDNIGSFGGDKSRVTLMGHFGGAVMVNILLHSPKAKGLFSGAILQSGSVWSSSYFNEKQRGRLRAKALAEELELLYASSSLLLKELNRISTEKLVVQEPYSLGADEAREEQINLIPFGPVIEHDHPNAVISKLPDAKDVTVPVMIGYTTREGMNHAERLLRKPQYLTFVEKDFPLMFPRRVNYKFKLNKKPMFDAIQDIKNFYFDEGYIKVSRPGEFIAYMGDIVSIYPIDYAVRQYTNETNIPVYYYIFDYSGDLNMEKNKILDLAATIEGTWGAALGDDLCYLFVCKPLRKKYKKILKEADSDDLKVIKNMVKLWTNFAKTGNPTPSEEDVTWTPATKENKECLVISDELEIKANVYEENIKFWDDFITKYEAQAVEGIVTEEHDEL